MQVPENTLEDYELMQMMQGMQASQNMPAYQPLKKKDPDLGKWETDFDEYVEKSCMFFRGYMYDSQVKKWIKNDKATPCINEDGMNMIMSELHVHLTKLISLSKLSTNDIQLRMMRLMTSFGNLIYENFEKYKIPNWSIFEVIMEFIETVGISILRRAENGWEAVNRLKVIQIQSNTLLNETPQNKGFLKKFALWRSDK